MTKAQQVREYIALHPNSTVEEVSKAVSTVRSTIWKTDRDFYHRASRRGPRQQWSTVNGQLNGAEPDELTAIEPDNKELAALYKRQNRVLKQLQSCNSSADYQELGRQYSILQLKIEAAHGIHKINDNSGHRQRAIAERPAPGF